MSCTRVPEEAFAEVVKSFDRKEVADMKDTETMKKNAIGLPSDEGMTRIDLEVKEFRPTINLHDLDFSINRPHLKYLGDQQGAIETRTDLKSEGPEPKSDTVDGNYVKTLKQEGDNDEVAKLVAFPIDKLPIELKLRIVRIAIEDQCGTPDRLVFLRYSNMLPVPAILQANSMLRNEAKRTVQLFRPVPRRAAAFYVSAKLDIFCVFPKTFYYDSTLKGLAKMIKCIVERKIERLAVSEAFFGYILGVNAHDSDENKNGDDLVKKYMKTIRDGVLNQIVGIKEITVVFISVTLQPKESDYAYKRGWFLHGEEIDQLSNLKQKIKAVKIKEKFLARNEQMMLGWPGQLRFATLGNHHSDQ